MKPYLKYRLVNAIVLTAQIAVPIIIIVVLVQVARFFR